MRTLRDQPFSDRRGDQADGPGSTLEQTLGILWKRRATFAIFFLTTIAAIAAVTFLLPKVYSTRAFILVEPDRSGSDFAAVEFTKTLANTYSELLESPETATRVSQALNFHLSEGELSDSITISPVADTQLLTVEAEGSTPNRARVLANTYAAVFIDRVKEIGAQVRNPARITVADYSSLPTSPSRPKPKLYLLIGAILAAALATAAVLLRERLAQRLEIDTSTTQILNRPVIGRIPASRGTMTAFSEPDTVAARMVGEPFRLLHTNLSFATVNRRPLSIGVMSAESGEGKSVCAANLALIAAEFGESVLLVDADMRLGTLSQRLRIQRADGGLSSLLSGALDPVSLSTLTVDIPGTRLRFLPAGRLPPNPGALLGSDDLRRLDSYARAEFDLVIYDCPPMTIGADASLVAAQSGGVVFVIDAERTRRKSALQALDQLERTSAEILGVVINRAPGAGAAYGYYYPGMGEAHASDEDERERRLRVAAAESRARPHPDGGSLPPVRDRR